MSNPLELADRAGQGALWAQVRALSNAYLDATNRGDTYEAHRLERRLSYARVRLHALHGKPLPKESTP